MPRRAGALICYLLTKNGELLGETTADRLTFVSELAALVGSRQEPQEVGDVLEAAFALESSQARAWQMAVRKGAPRAPCAAARRLDGISHETTAGASALGCETRESFGRHDETGSC